MKKAPQFVRTYRLATVAITVAVLLLVALEVARI
jgi:hypothetical protein